MMQLFDKLKMKIRIPISIKIILITTIIILGCMILITKQSNEYLRKAIVEREEFTNLTEASLRTAQIETVLDTSLEKAKSVGQLILKENNESLTYFQLPKDKYLVGVEVWKITDGYPSIYFQKSQNDFLKKYNFTQEQLSMLLQKTPFPIASVMQKKIEIQFANINSGSIRLINIGFPLARDAKGQVNFFAVARFSQEMIQSLFSFDGTRDFFLVDRAGYLLAHKNEDYLSMDNDWSKNPLFIKSLENENVKQKQVTIVDAQSGDEYIGAFVKSPFWGVTLLAQTPIKIVVEPADGVQRTVIYIAGIVMSVSLFLVFLFSLTITKPIEILAELIKEIPKGNFDISARERVNSKDEVGDLAFAFDHMTDGLKERDKVKNLFNKFHGSSITENLLSQEISVGGTRKDVTVFFSDIRGFTKFSEGHSPEEVVSMLNEYFEVMVKIINDHGGVVDKFIGDAIMAVWGVPSPGPHDTENALSACLKMREALHELNRSRANRGLSEIHIGMGLHAGAAISGTIGSEQRMEFTVIGDTVNVTSRIESATKNFEVDLLISDEVFRRLESEQDKKFKFHLAGDIEVKGKSLPLTLYKVAS
ncbi:MAG: adenylate/guanylate cyclase domain-containing protein [Pseudobdellovibrio sp.]